MLHLLIILYVSTDAQRDVSVVMKHWVTETRLEEKVRRDKAEERKRGHLKGKIRRKNR